MAEQKAIKDLELCKESRLFIPTNDVLNMAIKALEKQIPKKPIEIKGLTFGLTKDGGESYVIICECPNCRSRKLKRGFPCRCGQLLDWE